MTRLLFIFLIFIHNVYANEIFLVKDIKAYAKSSDATKAQRIALLNAQKEALTILLQRITNLDENEITNIHLSDRDIQKLVKSYNLNEEKVTRSTYETNVDIAFEEKLVKSFLNNINIEMVIDRKEIVIIPLYNNKLEENEWFSSWQDLIKNGITILQTKNSFEINTYKLDNNIEDHVFINYSDIDKKLLSFEFFGKKSYSNSFEVNNASINSLIKESLKIIDEIRSERNENNKISITIAIENLEQFLKIKNHLNELPYIKKLEVFDISIDRAKANIEHNSKNIGLDLKLNGYDLDIDNWLTETNNAFE